MKKIWIAVGRFVYGTWYGAMVVFVAVTVLLHGLQLANSGFGDIIAWPKVLHIIMMLLRCDHYFHSKLRFFQSTSLTFHLSPLSFPCSLHFRNRNLRLSNKILYTALYPKR